MTSNRSRSAVVVCGTVIVYLVIVFASVFLVWSLDRWLDCSRTDAAFNWSFVGAGSLTTTGLLLWAAVRPLVRVGPNPRQFMLRTWITTAVVALGTLPLYYLTVSPWTKYIADFRTACGVVDAVALQRGLLLYLPLFSLMVMQFVVPPTRPVRSWQPSIIILVVAATWAVFSVMATPFSTPSLGRHAPS